MSVFIALFLVPNIYLTRCIHSVTIGKSNSKACQTPYILKHIKLIMKQGESAKEIVNAINFTMKWRFEYFLPFFFFLNWTWEFSEQQRSYNIWERQVPVAVAVPLLLLIFVHIGIAIKREKVLQVFWKQSRTWESNVCISPQGGYDSNSRLGEKFDN